MKLAIISHTEHYKTSDGTIVGWGPTVNEINHLLEVFEDIYHISMLHDGAPPPSVMPYTSSKITFIPLPALGGNTLGAKLSTLWHAPKVISIVHNTLKNVDCFQLRTPTGIGVFLIPYLSLCTKKKGWFKYAGNWNQDRPPLGYRLQRYLLKIQSRPVTINGQWDDQPAHCVTFENPCLTAQDLIDGIRISHEKTYDGPLTFCFVGRLERTKGVEVIIKAFGLLTDSEKQRVNTIHLVGDGHESNYFKTLAKAIPHIKFLFHGFLSRQDVFNIYAQSHVFMLPSMASEGFPKVIAEAMNFGCIPVVSNVSSISQYINASNGYILNAVTIDEMAIPLKHIINLPATDFKHLMRSDMHLIDKFSFMHYNARIKTLLNID